MFREGGYWLGYPGGAYVNPAPGCRNVLYQAAAGNVVSWAGSVVKSLVVHQIHDIAYHGLGDGAGSKVKDAFAPHPDLLGPISGAAQDIFHGHAHKLCTGSIGGGDSISHRNRA